MQATPPKSQYGQVLYAVPSLRQLAGAAVVALSQRKTIQPTIMPYRKPSRTYTQTKRKSKLRGPSKGSVLATIRSAQPAKHISRQISANLLQNEGQSANLTANIVQGVEDSERLGDSVYLEAVKLNVTCETPTTAGAYSFRLIAGFSGEEYSNVSMANTGLSYAQMFLPATGATNFYQINNAINAKAFTTLFDQVVNINSTISSVRDTQSFHVTIPLKQKFDYQSAFSVYGKTKNLYVYGIGSVAGGTDNTTAVGNVFVTYDLIFK